jgi:hypothetical protein
MCTSEDTLYVEVYTFYMKTLAECLLISTNGAVVVDQRGISALIRVMSSRVGSPTVQQMPLDRTGADSQLRSWAI